MKISFSWRSHKVQQLLDEQIGADHSESSDPADQAKRERQIRKLHKQADRIEKWLNHSEPRIGTSGKEIQSNVTDDESAKMHTSQFREMY